MEGKQDLRITRTQHLLFEAFTELLEERGFENITVKDLCEKAMIRRTTFYKHFSDKYEYLDYYVNRIREAFCIVEPSKETEFTEDFLLRVTRSTMAFFEEKRVIIHRILNSNMPSTLMAIFEKQVFDGVKEHLDLDVVNGRQLPLPMDFYAAYYAGGYSSMMQLWFMNQDKYTKDDVLQGLKALLPATVI